MVSRTIERVLAFSLIAMLSILLLACNIGNAKEESTTVVVRPSSPGTTPATIAAHATPAVAAQQSSRTSVDVETESANTPRLADADRDSSSMNKPPKPGASTASKNWREQLGGAGCGLTKLVSEQEADEKKLTKAMSEGRLLMQMNVPSDTTPDTFPKVCGVPIEPIEILAPQRIKPQKILKQLKFLLKEVSNTLPADHRRAFFDLGARMFDKGSTEAFAKKYPESKTFEVHAFEVLDLKSTYTPAKNWFTKGFTYHQAAAWIHDRGVAIKGLKMAKVSDGIDAKNDIRSEWKSPSVDIAKFLMTNYKKTDFIVVKLDIEGGEWTLLPHLIKTGALEWVDELLLECHALDSSANAGKGFPMNIPTECVDLTNDLRSRGVFAHRWF